MNLKDKKEILTYLDKEQLMSLATSDTDVNLWSALVYYLFNDDLSIYFLSKPIKYLS